VSPGHPLFKHLYISNVDSFGYSVCDNTAVLRADIGMAHGEFIDSFASIEG
jgi:hypothetical protein